MNGNDAAIRKRSQISKANRTMFIWIALASAVVGSAGVVGYFLAQKLVYNEKVLSAKQQTLSTLESNNKAVEDLRQAVNVLDTNRALASVKANESDRTVQVVLDALPSEANSLAFGASLQNKLLDGIPGLTIDSMSVSPVAGIEVIDSTVEGGGAVATDGTEATAIPFQFVVKGDRDALKQVLSNLERSIRYIEVLTLNIDTQDGAQVMTVSARAFYEPKKVIELKEEVVPR